MLPDQVSVDTVLPAAAAFLLVVAAVALHVPVGDHGTVVERIEYQNRVGNIQTTELYIVELAGNATFRYSRTVPGAGMLCDTDDPKGDCKVRTEPGFEAVDAAVDGEAFRKVQDGFPTVYRPTRRVCASNATDSFVELGPC